ncbi:MmgE/PrpD family protein [Chloroflexota bacterium]
MKKDVSSSDSVIREVSSYISRNAEAKLPAEVITKTKHHIMDTLAAMVSGSKLKAGQVAIKYANDQGGVPEAQVVGSQTVTSAVNAALANGLMAHADETDDSHAKSHTHPGCAIVPAALAMSEREEADGMSFLKAVVVGYDIGCRITQALGVDNIRQVFRSTHSMGGVFGAAAAAAAIARLENQKVNYILSYTAQQAAGLTYWVRDNDHIEKAFVFGGMPARNGVTAATLIQSGFTGVLDPFSGERNIFEVFSSPRLSPQLLTEELGSHYEIMFTNIKKFSVGSPIQAPLQALLLLIEKHRLASKDVKSITVRLGDRWSSKTVNDRAMPDINLQHILAVTLLDGDLTFATAHSRERMNDPVVLELKRCIKLVVDPELVAAKIKRQGIVDVTTKDGGQLREHVVSVRGTVENPMTTEEVEKKCQDLLIPVLGEERSQELINRIWNLEQVKNVRELRPLLSAP